ncbi:MAG: hybrid sensor histidine kinase/response regulator [Verrucomicrobiota bacterium]
MNTDTPPFSNATIMVVEDIPANLNLLTSLLKSRGYKVQPAISGEVALQAAHRSPPDLILLDINMPRISGYEVCKRLKADANLKTIPVIFISALNETSNLIEGFALGAVDYVTKPFEFSEVMVRVRTHLELVHLRRELEQQNARLEDQVAKRTRELAEAHARLAILDRAKSDFLHLISHELRTPLNGVLGVTEMLLATASQDVENREFAGMYEASRDRLMTMVDDSLLLTQLGVGMAADSQQACRLETLLIKARSEAVRYADSRGVQLAPAPLDLGLVQGAPTYLVRALRSLLETAVKFTQVGSLVRLTKADASEPGGLIIETDGLGIPPEMLPRVFDLLAVAEPITPGGDLGVALPLAERIISLCGGAVVVENLTPPGVRFTVRFKKLEPNNA